MRPALRLGRLVVVSPHLDDAVLSAFGLLSAATSATVVTVFAGVPAPGTPPADYDRLTRADAPAVRVADRRAEDRAALARLGARAVHLDFLDGPYRDADPSVRVLADAIVAVVPPHDTLVLPAAIGSHADHVLAREAALLVPCGGRRLAMADLPYAAWFGWPPLVTGHADDDGLDPAAPWQPALRRLAEASRGTPMPVVVRLSREERRAKLECLRLYASQFAALEAGPSREISHPSRIRAEVFWRLDGG